jgi:hypothetical protein
LRPHVLLIWIMLGLPCLAAGQERLLVAISVRGREVAVEEVLREGSEFLLPLQQFAEWTACRFEGDAATLRIATDLGAVPVPPDAVRVIDGVRYLRQSFAEQRLAVRLAYDPTELTLRLDVPWGAQVKRSAAQAPVPNAVPPATSVSKIREDLFYSEQDGVGATASSTLLAGRLAGGNWRIRLDSDFAGNPNLQEYAWMTSWGRNLLLFGEQRISLHPLLNGVELTGGQYAWTNRPLKLYSQLAEGRELVPRSVQPVATFRGQGPPGGLAELRIDGAAVARVTIGLDGWYEFLDFPLPARQLSRVEAYVYARDNLLVPAAVIAHDVSLSEYLLPAGTVIHMGGAGVEGNLVNQVFQGPETHRAAGFYQWRYGVSSGVTFEAAVQRTNGIEQAETGLVAKLARNLVATVGLGYGNGKGGYQAEVDWQSTLWRLSAQSLQRPAGFAGDSATEEVDRGFDFVVRPSSRLEVGLIAHQRQAGGETVDFVLPGVTVRPFRGLSVRAWPNLDGTYLSELFWDLGRDSRLIVTRQDHTVADLTTSLSGRYLVSFGTEFGGPVVDRFSAVVRMPSLGKWSPDVSVGAIVSGGKAGVLLGANLPLSPGLLLRGEYQSVPMSRQQGAPASARLLLGLSTDFAVAGGRLVPADNMPWFQDRGAIAGRVSVEDGGRSFGSLANVVVLLNGRPGARTQPGGSFFIGNLAPGVYQVELDQENLPIELMPEGRIVVAKVEAGAVTSVQLVVRPEYGVAGRTRDRAGRPLGGVSIELLNALGITLKADVTDQFGLFRIDGVPPGSYTLRVLPAVCGSRSAESVERAVVVRADFVFDQDLVVPCDGPQAPASPSPPRR